MGSPLDLMYERKDDSGRVDMQVFLIPTRKDKFVHFTTHARALQILASGKLLFNPPHHKMGIDAVTAVSLVWGSYVPRVQTDHLKKLDEPLVALIFQTTTRPDYGRLDEVVWESDVVLKNPKVVSFEKGVAALQRAPYTPTPASNIYYDVLPVAIETWIERQMTTRRAAAAKYKKKKEVPKADGKGTTTVYEYSERQVQNRHRDKANRLEDLRKGLTDLRAKVRQDLKSKDAKTRMTALAVALIDETYERVGNEGSAEDGHYGVTGWLKSHVMMSGSKATIKYVGKSGVKQEKSVTTPAVLSVLREALQDKKATDPVFELEDFTIKSSHVNTYLKEFDITAKDLRGLHANQEMQRCLKQVRKDGPKLPTDPKEREKLLKDEFLEALEEVADIVGHESATLRKQYLVPGMEEDFMDDGKVNNSLKKSSRQKTAIIHIDNAYPNPKGSGHLEGEDGLLSSLTDMEKVLVRDMIRSGDSIFHIGDFYYFRGYDVRSDVVEEILWSGYLSEDENNPGVIKISDSLEAKLALYRTATKSKSEKEDEHADDQVKREPVSKPSRTDKRKRRMTDDDPDMVDAGGAGKDPDLSLNYKGVTAKAKDRSPGEVWQTGGGWWAMNPAGEKHGFYGPNAKDEAKEWSDAHPEDGEEGEEEPETSSGKEDASEQTPEGDADVEESDAGEGEQSSPSEDEGDTAKDTSPREDGVKEKSKKNGDEDGPPVLSPLEQTKKILLDLEKKPNTLGDLLDDPRKISELYEKTDLNQLAPAEREEFELLTRFVCAEKPPKELAPLSRLADKFILHQRKRKNYGAMKKQIASDPTPMGIVGGTDSMPDVEFAEYAALVDPAMAPLRKAFGRDEDGVPVLHPNQAKWLRDFSTSLLGHMDVLTDEIDDELRDKLTDEIEDLTEHLRKHMGSNDGEANQAGDDTALALAVKILEADKPKLDKKLKIKLEQAVQQKDARLLHAEVAPELLKKRKASLSTLFPGDSRREHTHARASCSVFQPINGRGFHMTTKKTAAKALALTAMIDRVASMIEATPGLDKRVTADFARKCDIISDIIEREAGVVRDATGKLANFDPEEIGREVDGLWEGDSDEDFMDDEFTQQENRELSDRFEDGDLDPPKTNLGPRSPEPGRQASLVATLDRLSKKASEADQDIHALSRHADDLKVCAKQLSKSNLDSAKSLSAPILRLVTALGDAQDQIIEAQADGRGGLLSIPVMETLSALNDAAPHLRDVTDRVLAARADSSPTTLVQLEELMSRDGGKYTRLAEITAKIVADQSKAMATLLKAAE